jgi:hypothetical protein
VFKRKTVLIIGVGASAEFNMPLGSQLTERVANLVVPEARWPDNPDKGLLLAPMRACLGDEEARRLFDLGPRLTAVAERSKLPSMDEVLHFLSDQDIVKLGKFAIAYEIMKAERNSHLFHAISFGQQTFIDMINRSWAGEFLGLALSGSQRPSLSNLFTNVTVVDFNYDRVLPAYLYWALQHNVDIPHDAAAECVRNLKILHPYASLGRLEWEAKEEVLPFGSPTGNLADIASRIRTYTEETESPERVQIQEAIGGAHVVIVVGFGYHKQNIAIITRTSAQRESRQVFMTVYGMNSNNHKAIKDAMLIALSCDPFEPVMYTSIGQEMFRELKPALTLALS